MILTTGMMLIPSTFHSRTPLGYTCLARSVLQRETTQRRNAEAPCQVSHACGPRGNAKADGTISRAFAEQLMRNREPRTDEYFVDAIHASHKRAPLAGTVICVLLQPVRCGQLWELAEAVEVSVRRGWRVSTQSEAHARTWSDAQCTGAGRCETRLLVCRPAEQLQRHWFPDSDAALLFGLST